MSNGNPLEQFRRRLQSQATPTAFAALAEEHRRAGRFAEAITVCRDGLQRYPAYASARVTLGRALLDSGDVPAAVAELELAAAQSPDNLAAARALQLAHDALGEDAAWPSAATSDPIGDDLPLRSPADQDTGAITPDVAVALGSEPDSPQDFGLGPDWSIPESTAAASAALPSGDAEPPMMPSLASHVQSHEPAGIWAAPAVECPPQAGPLSEDARIFSWALDPPEAGSSSEGSTAGLEWSANLSGTDVVLPEALSVPLAGWADGAATPEAGADSSPWASEAEPDLAESWTVPDGPSATWALCDLHEAAGADATPFQGSLDAPDATRVPFAGLVSSADVPSEPPAALAGAAWAGSVRSALGEVFALAGHGDPLEPPTPVLPAVRAALADVAVEAAVEDAALSDDQSAPVLASLEQMLAAVRARRAEIAGRSSF